MISFVYNTDVTLVCCKKLSPQMAERHVFLSFIDFVLHKHVNVISFVVLLTDFLSVLSTKRQSESQDKI